MSVCTVDTCFPTSVLMCMLQGSGGVFGSVCVGVGATGSTAHTAGEEKSVLCGLY